MFESYKKNKRKKRNVSLNKNELLEIIIKKVLTPSNQRCAEKVF